jgi:hypothetical protein
VFEQALDKLAARVVLCNSSSLTAGSRGRSIRDFISMSVAAITRKSLATVMSMPCIRRR